MKDWTIRIVACVAVLSAVMSWNPAAIAAEDARHVIIISIDGLSADAWNDPATSLPTLRQLAAEGAAARGMRATNPTVTWPNHTSIVTGVDSSRHGVLANGVIEPGDSDELARVDGLRDKRELVSAAVPTLYDVAHTAGMSTADINWPCTRAAATLDWSFPDTPAAIAHATPAFIDEIQAAGIFDPQAWNRMPIEQKDQAWTAMATHLIRQHQPRLMLVHLLAVDANNHRFGPGSQEARAAATHADGCVKQIVDALAEAGLRQRTTVFVVSDHGFKAVKRQIRPNAAFASAGLLTAADGKVVTADVYSVPEAGTALVYVTKEDPTGELLARARKALEGLEGVDRVIEPKDYGELGLPRPAESDQAGALFLTARDGYAFTADFREPAVVDAPPGSGSHGYVASDPDLRALFIASGRGIREGVTVDVVNTVDIAPTAATLLDLELKDVDGRVLKEILR